MTSQLTYKSMKRRWRQWKARQDVEARWFEDWSASPHGLSQPLIVSLTSHAARFGTLAQTLKGILHQTMRPDATILWVSWEDFLLLPENVLDLERHGLEIARCLDMRSFTKIVPTLKAYPESFIITVDDDVYYQNDFIEKLITAYEENAPRIICHRAHKVRLTPSGQPRPYEDWDRTCRGAFVSPYAFPTGVMGVLYPPNVFHEDVCDQQKFGRLCPTADDIWLYWMWRLTGHLAHKVGGHRRIVEWPDSQSVNLRMHNNNHGGNDFCIANMVKRYGWPDPGSRLRASNAAP